MQLKVLKQAYKENDQKGIRRLSEVICVSIHRSCGLKGENWICYK